MLFTTSHVCKPAYAALSPTRYCYIHTTLIGPTSHKSCFLRNNVDAELQAAVAHHATECEKQLADRTAAIDTCLSKVSDGNVMHMEEAAVHEVRQSAHKLVYHVKSCSSTAFLDNIYSIHSIMLYSTHHNMYVKC